MKNLSITQKIVVIISMAILLMSFIILPLFVSNEAGKIEQNTINKIQILAEREAARVTSDFNIQVDKVKSQVLNFENFIETGYTNRLVASNMLQKIVTNNGLICSAWVVFEQNNFDGKDSEFANSPEYDKSGRFVCWWHNLKNDSLTLEPLPNFEQEDWYIKMYNNKGTTLLEPYFYPLESGKNQMFISVGSPIIFNDSLLGITGNEMSLEHIQDLISGINVFEDDYACLISHCGIYASHPIADKIGQKTGFAELNDAQKEKLGDGNIIMEKHISEYLHKEVFDFYISVQINDIDTPLYLRVSVPTDIVNKQVVSLRNKLIFSLSGIVLVILLILYVVLYFSIRPITKITNLITQLSSNGIDGAVAIKEKSNDEIGKLGKSYNRLLNSLVEKRRIEIELKTNQIKLKEKNGKFEAINEELKQSNEELQNKNIELINTKEKAKESELQLNLIADNFVNGMLYQVAVLDENKRRFNYVSKAVKKLYDATPDEIMQNPDLIYSKVHPDDIADLIAKEKVALQNMSVFETEARMINADGSIRWAYFISKPRIINGVMCFDGIELDITKRKQLEFSLITSKEKAEESERKLKETLDEVLLQKVENAALLEAAKQIPLSNNFTECAKNIFEICKNTIGAHSGYVALLSEDGSENEVLYLDAGGLPCTVNPELPMPIRGLREVAYRNNDSAFDNNFMNSDWVKFMPHGHVKLDNVMFAPLIINKKAVGLIGLANKDGGFTSNDAKLANAFGNLASIGLQLSNNKDNLISAIEKAEESETKFKAAFYTSPDAVSFSTITGEYVEINEGFTRISGYTETELLGKTSSELDLWKVPEERNKFVAILQKNNYIENFESLFQAKNGTTIPALVSARIIMHKNEPFILAVTRDITERKKYETKLLIAKERAEESEERFALAMNAAKDGLYDWNLVTNEIYYSPGWKRMLGYNDEELPNDFSVWEKLTEPKDVQKSWDMQQQLINKQRDRFEMEFKMKHKDGHWVDILSRADVVFNEDGKAIRMVGTHIDISERKRAQEKIRVAEENLKNTFNLSPSIIAKVNLNTGYFLEASSAVTRILGYTIKEFTTKPMWEFIHPDDRKETDVLVAAHISGNNITYFENRYLCKDGSFKWMAWHGRQGDKDGIVTTIGSDITVRKLSEKELENYQHNLEKLVKERTEELETILQRLKVTQVTLVQSEKMASLGVLVAGIAHEINNPINFISSSVAGLKNNIDFLTDYFMLYDKLTKENYNNIIKLVEKKKSEASFNEVFEMFKKSIEIIEIGVERTSKIVKGLKSFAHSADKKLDRYPLHENIDNTLLLLFNQYKNRIEIIKEYGQVPIITCCPGQINQLIMNILTNAIQAIENKGEIRITTGIKDKESVFIKVKDSGKGMPSEVKKCIFDPFFTTKEVGKGTGLGLSISYGIIEEHNGEILVESEMGKGSSFEIILPVK